MSSVECCLDYLLLLLPVEVWNLEVVVELEGYCRRLDYLLETVLLAGVLLLSYCLLRWHCRMDWTSHLRPTLCLLLDRLVDRLLLTPYIVEGPKKNDLGLPKETPPKQAV